MHCFYCEKKNITEENIRILGPDVNHMKNVLRMKPGEEIIISDGQGREFRCMIDGMAEDVHAKILEEKKTEPSAVEKELTFINPDMLSPREALDVLYKLKSLME